jgi:L-asparaginase II
MQLGAKLDGVPMVDVHRGNSVESRHRIAACAVNASGRTLLELGTIDAFGFDEGELALMCASHAAEPEHIEGVLSMLRKAEIEPAALRCGGTPSALYNNCSGKHAGILAFAKHIGAPLESYLEPDNAVQREILALCERVVREPLPPERIAVDGCGIPVFATSLRRAAHAFARFATLEDLDARDRDALARVRAAMAAFPWQVSGTGRFDTALIHASGGTIIGKGGAEGVHGSALVAQRAGLVIKVIDGNGRAAPPAVVSILERLEAIDRTLAEALAPFREPPVRNVAGRIVGSIQGRVPDS